MIIIITINKGLNGAERNKREPRMTVITKPVDENAPWVEKFRPKSLEDISSHGEIISTIKRLTSMNRLPHLLLHGPPGTGKTSTILAIARQIYGEKAFKSMILELNASDDRNISVVREQIQVLYFSITGS